MEEKEEKQINLDEIDKLVLTLYKNKELEDDVDYTISKIEEDEKSYTILLERPTYSYNPTKEWKTARKIVKMSCDSILELKQEIGEKYSFADLTDEEYLKRRVYNFTQNGLFYIERKKPIIENGKRAIERTKVVTEKDKVISINKFVRNLSDSLPVAQYKTPFSRPSISLGYGNNYDYFDDNSFVL